MAASFRDGNLTDLPTRLSQLRGALNDCRRCGLYRNATQGVPGEGPKRATLMIVGEQPGNDEDLEGAPFVGPAGRVLDRALAEAGIDRKKVYVTNAVKHFKFARRGKRRLHQRPDASEIAACHIWIEIERKLVRPKLVVAMGATAARSVLGKTTTISKVRGRILDSAEGAALVTVHPSFILRIPDEKDRHAEFARFVQDLSAGRRWLEG